MLTILQPWPWYVVGPLIGLMVPLLLWMGNKSLGVSSTFRQICAATYPANISFLKYDWKKESWNLYFVIGLFLSGIICSQFLENQNPFVLDSSVKNTLENYGFKSFDYWLPREWEDFSFIFSFKGLMLLVGGGFLVGFGSRYAGGCTSGHAIAGLSNLQIPSLVSVIGFFIGGLLMVHLIIPFLFSL